MQQHIQKLSLIDNFDVISNPGMRVKIDTGLFCNYKCEFCYYIDRLDEKKQYNDIIKRVNELYNIGFRDFDLSGGEPTILPFFFDIIDYIKNLKCNVSCLSNGYKLSNTEFATRAFNAGLHEVLFSLHGSNEEIHESITKIKGSFNKIIKAIKNIKNLGGIVRINCTLYDKNYIHLDEYIDLINSLNIDQVNFILLNYNEDQKNRSGIKLYDIAQKLDSLILSIKCNDVRVRYIPFCYMKNAKIYNYKQIIFDKNDWTPLHSYTDSKNSIISIIDDNIKYTNDLRAEMFTKNVKCLKCKYFYVCDGLKLNDKDKDVYPIIGEKIKVL